MRQAYRTVCTAAAHRFDPSHDSWEPEDHVSVNVAATFRKRHTPVPEPRWRASDLLGVNSNVAEEKSEQLWAQCDSCSKWRRLPESMRDSNEFDEAWTCAMHPDPARRGCEVAEEGLGEDEVAFVEP